MTEESPKPDPDYLVGPKGKPAMLLPNGRRSPFIPGNKLAVGNKSIQARRHVLTRELMRQLDNVDPRTDETKGQLLIKRLIEMAVGYDYEEEVLDHKGKVVKLRKYRPPDLQAIVAVMNRTDGLPKQQLEIDDKSEKVYRTVDEVRQALLDRGIPVDVICAEAQRMRAATIAGRPDV